MIITYLTRKHLKTSNYQHGMTNIPMTAPFYSWPSKAQVRLGSFSPQIRSVSPISVVRYIFFVTILTNFQVLCIFVVINKLLLALMFSSFELE